MKKVFILLFLVFAILLMSKVFAADKVEINTASLQQLDEITGIGPVLAQRIIDARPFSSVDDLLRIKGIGEKTLQKIKDQGLAFVSGQTPISNSQLPISNEIQSPNDQNATTQEQPTTPQDSQEVEPPLTYPEGIVFNEILPSPEGPDSENEWIEIFNSNDFEADISGWKIKDKIGKTSTYIFPEKTKIPAKGFLIIPITASRIVLNNDEDGLELTQPNGKIIDSADYQKAKLGQSYNREENSSWFWSNILTPGYQNTLPEKEIKGTPSLSEQKTEDGPLLAKSFSGEGKNEPAKINFQKNNSFWIWLIAFLTAVFSGIIILILKKNLKSL